MDDDEDDEPDATAENDEEEAEEVEVEPPKPLRRKSGKQPEKAKKGDDEEEDEQAGAMRAELFKFVKGFQGLGFPGTSKKCKAERNDFDVCRIEFYWTRPGVGVREPGPPGKEIAYFSFGKEKWDFSIATAAACANMLVAKQTSQFLFIPEWNKFNFLYPFYCGPGACTLAKAAKIAMGEIFVGSAAVQVFIARLKR